MARRTLDNAAWGFESSCFVCEPGNERGLRIPFSYDDESRIVSAEFCLGRQFSGTPRYVHGGVVLAVLDEAMAWAAIAVAGKFAVVRETSSTFSHPVRVGQSHRVEAVVDAHDNKAVAARAEVVDADGRRCVESSAWLVVLSEAGAQSAIGEVTGSDVTYLRRKRR